MPSDVSAPIPDLPSDALSEDDVLQLYRACLGRDPDPGVAARAAGRPLAEMALEMLRSEEMALKVLTPLVQQRALPHSHLTEADRVRLWRWMGQRLGCPGGEPLGRVRPERLLQRLCTHPRLVQVLADVHGGLFTEVAARLAQPEALDLQGKIEFANHEFISGWVTDLSEQRATLRVAVHCQGRLVATGSAHSLRPDIREHIGGSGLCGFRLPWRPQAWPAGQALDLQLVEAGTDTPVGALYRYENSRLDQLGVAQLLSKELEEIQRRIDVLAEMVPQALRYAAFPLDHYDLYRRTHRVPPPPWLQERAWAGVLTPPAASEGPAFMALIDGGAGDPIAARRTVDALRAQPWPHWQAVVVGAGRAVAEVAALMAAAEPRVRGVAGWDDLPASAAPWWLLLEAGEQLDPMALPWLVHAARQSPQAAALYWDEDTLLYPGGRAPAREERHVRPLLRRAFDADAMLELNGVGRSLALRAAALQAVAPALSAAAEGALSPAPAAREALVWALARQGALVHVPQFLLSRVGEAQEEVPGDAVQRLVAQADPETLSPWLPAAWQGRRWQRVDDPLGASPKPLVRWTPQRPEAVLSVLLPTRDQLGLLRDCIDTLREQALHPGALDIVVADNGSTEPETLAYLAEGAARGDFRVLRIDEPFNWSRLNNRMAEAARGEHLLLLNNDTRMLTAQWDDILRGLLEREDVLAVGARLLYEDMTIQHAGVLTGQERFVAHDAVGVPVDDGLGLLGPQLTRRMPAVTGAFLACTAATYAATGGMDEAQLSVTFNDVDWCQRAGQRFPDRHIVYSPLLSLVHLESKSRGFDFQDPLKQARADYERQAFEARSGGWVIEDRGGNPQLSHWVRPGTALG
ncbi:glycosyltransferase [Ideonella sp. B7]|uniref:glycosyltransferase n=1 Tax=Ideonella benzenivorans TaxID=2831643 RepID=UPI001CED5877|nr:glycosyltransferase [Ideonella benzenivorans]MCA6215282.1 glycosyltransferase [Ideonella benzenivorans]